MDSQSKDANNQNIVDNNQLNIWEALIPVFALVGMLFYNVLFAFGDDALSGSNQFILLLGAAVAAIVAGVGTVLPNVFQKLHLVVV